MNKDLAEYYEAAHTGCVLIDRDPVARFWSSGEHRIDLINRMSTNDLEGMVEFEGRPTVLTNATARIIDYLLVLHLGERALLLASPGQGEEVRRWLSGYIFYQDDIAFTDASEELAQFGLYGTQALRIVTELAGVEKNLPLHNALPIGAALAIRMPALAGEAIEFIVPRGDLDGWISKVVAAGAKQAPPELYEILRVEAGLPGAGHEITADFIPLEVNLWDAISFSKGCYIGQEIIARMESRGKLAKTLVGLRAESALLVGAQLKAENGARGVITSSVHSPRNGWLGLGLVKPNAAVPGMSVVVQGNGDSTQATIAALPIV